MKKWIAFVLMTCMLLSVGSGALAFEEPLKYQGTFPFSETPIELTAFTTDVYYKQCDFNDIAIWPYLAEKTNISFDFEAYSDDIVNEKLSLMLTRSDDELPNVIFRVGMSNADVMELAEEEIIVPITDYLEEYAPNYWHMIQENPALKAYVTMNDGEIYGFCELYYADNYMTSPVFVQQEWLNALGYDKVPEDLEELKQLLIAFRDSDLNGNGEKDEVGLIATSLDSLVRLFTGAFGINTRGRTSVNLDMDDDGNLRFIPTSDGYRKMLTYLNELYEEGLIYPEIFTSSIANMTAVGEQNRVLIGKGSLHYLGANNRENYEGMTTIFKGPDGYQFNADIVNSIGQQNTFITCNNENIEETLRYFDYFYSWEGNILYYMGFEGVTYDVDENGMPWLNDYVNNNPDGLINEEVLCKYTAWGGAANPSLYSNAAFGNQFYTAMESAVCSERIKYGVSEAWGSFNYTNEEYEQLSLLESDIKTYVTDMRAKFIKGDADIETEWDSYVQTLQNMKLDSLMAIYQSGLDRYQAITNQ